MPALAPLLFFVLVLQVPRLVRPCVLQGLQGLELAHGWQGLQALELAHGWQGLQVVELAHGWQGLQALELAHGWQGLQAPELAPPCVLLGLQDPAPQELQGWRVLALLSAYLPVEYGEPLASAEQKHHAGRSLLESAELWKALVSGGRCCHEVQRMDFQVPPTQTSPYSGLTKPMTTPRSSSGICQYRKPVQEHPRLVLQAQKSWHRRGQL